MIIVDVEILMLGKTYNFQIDENEKLGSVAVRMKEIICTQENCPMEEDIPMLWDGISMRRFDLFRTASEEGIQTGSKLLFA